ncbi:MAG: WalW protein [Pseudomonadota bacterium]|uniref:WalW protein n=1 Tax=Sphingomonas ginsenosidimutans TaxID=862134 RepID=UPI001FEB7025|nr:WalW protein [Sphingomonas ginsenosidimutans]MEE2917075.1 WalW protein [Pseudomonadota bacterium]
MIGSGAAFPPVDVTAHRLRFATDPATCVRWPASFGRRFLVTVDVEEEFDWSRPFSGAARQVAAVAALPAWHVAMRDRGVAPVYVVDHPVATDPAAAALIAPLLTDGSEAGAQLHPWVNPPQVEVPGELASFAGNLPESVEAAKIDELFGALTAAFGRAPRLYRAGRYGLGPATLRLLAGRGIAVDASMRARFDYRDHGGPDFTGVDGAAFRTVDGVIELPLSVVYTGLLHRAGRWLHPVATRVSRGGGVLARTGLLSRVPLTPEGTPLPDAVRAIRRAARDGARLLQLAFHSPSLVPGNTPYVRDAADLAHFHRWWGGVLDALERHGFAPVTLDEVIRAV